jgi:hypothetical protein
MQAEFRPLDMDMAASLPSQGQGQGQGQGQTRKRKIFCKQELIVNSLQKFYAERNDTDEILTLLQGTSVLSLRLIDWFVTNYAKRHNTSYIVDNQEFIVYNNYKSQLKAYSKKLFDPFCRRERILFQIPNQEPFLTTVGKLNFFRWALEKNVITYLKLNTAAVEKEMNTAMREQNKLRNNTATSTTSTTSTVSDTTVTSTVTDTSIGQTSQSSQSQTRATRRRTSPKELEQVKKMHKHEFQIEMRFD